MGAAMFSSWLLPYDSVQMGAAMSFLQYPFVWQFPREGTEPRPLIRKLPPRT